MPVEETLEDYEDDVGIEDDDNQPTAAELASTRNDRSPHWLWAQVRKRRNPDATVWEHIQAEQAPDLPLKPAKALRPGDNGFRTEPANDTKPVPRKPRVTPPGALLTSSQVADVLNVARSTVEGIPASELPFAHVGKGRQRLRRRYRKDDVDAYIQRLCNRSADEDQMNKEREPWAQAVSSESQGARTGISASTTPARGGSTGNRPTPPTKSSLGSAWLKLKGS
jgi:Helix-turn-helix domain